MSQTNGRLNGRRVLVTGATGFIGGHLAERLARDEGALVTAVGRRTERHSHLTAPGIDNVVVDLTDSAALPSLVQGHDFVCHCAAWLPAAAGHADDEAAATAINVAAGVALLEAAAEAGVQRFLHLSSIAAYGPPLRPVYDEATPVANDQPMLYGRTKAVGETAVRRCAAALPIELVVVRPAQVYGPRAQEWSVSMLDLVRKRVPVIIGGGQGQVHPIYIDDLVTGLLLAVTTPAAAGEIFNLAGPPITWHTFFSHYGRMANRRLYGLPLWLGRWLAVVNETLHLGLPLTRQTITFYEAITRYPTEHAQRLLGYAPAFSLDEGMARTGRWLAEAGYLT